MMIKVHNLLSADQILEDVNKIKKFVICIHTEYDDKTMNGK
jgi:hypothetical protein